MTTPLIFGIYPGSATEVLGAGVPDDPAQIQAALNQLQPEGRPFLVRCYQGYGGAGRLQSETPASFTQYACNGRQIDLVLCYRPTEADMPDWTAFIRATIRRYGRVLATLQITEEPNNPDAATGGDGSSPDIHQAILHGVMAAKDEARKLGLALQVGFNAAVSFAPVDAFWSGVAALVTPEFLSALDYVGLDFFPDVFRPLPATLTMHDAVVGVLRQFRHVNLVNGAIPASVPMHITEHGYATSPERSSERQAEVMETALCAINALRDELNITHYACFDLRDTDSTATGLQFGLMRDDYSPKPAFDVLRRLAAEFSR